MCLIICVYGADSDLGSFIFGIFIPFRVYDGLITRLLDGQRHENHQTIKPSDHQDVIVKLILSTHLLIYPSVPHKEYL